MPQLLYNTGKPEFTSLDFTEIVLEASRSGRLPEHLFIVPTYRKLRELERKITDVHFAKTGRPIGHIPIHTFRSFVGEFHDRLAPAKREVSPEIQIALMERAMRSVDLSFYARGGNPSLGVVEQITRVINGVRADGIMPSDFARDLEYAEETPESGYDIAKLRDLYNIYAEYLRLLRAHWIDYPGKMALLNTALFNDRNAAFRRAYPRMRTILVHGFSEFTFPEMSLLHQLGFVEELQSLIYFDYEQGNGPLYGNFDEVIDKLTAGGYGLLDLDPLEIDIPERERRPFKHHMRRNLFRTDERIENSAFDRLMNVYGFFNREEEVQGIAALVKSLVLDDGFLPERICITTLAMNRYGDLFREHLAAHGVPANIAVSFPLERNSLVTALFSALNVLARDYDRRDVLRAVTSPYLSFGEGVDPAALTDAALKLRIVRGRYSWSRRIERRADFLRSRLMRIADEEDRRGIELELETLGRADRSIRAVQSVLAEFDHRMTPTGFRAAFLRLIAKLRATENVLRLRHNLEARTRTPQDWQRVHDEIERDTRALARFLRLLDELTEFFQTQEPPVADGTGTGKEEGMGTPDDIQVPEERTTSDDGEGEHLHPLEFYLEQLRTAAALAFYQIREKHDYGVLVAPIEQMRDMEFDLVIVCGLVDGEFPSTYIPESFLGKPLPKAQDRQLKRERVDFYQAITEFEKRLVITYPRYAGETALVRSPFLDAFLRITTVEESGRALMLDELRVVRDRFRRGEAPIPHTEFLSYLATYESLAEEAGTAIWNGERIPRIDAAEDMLDNLRHTARVERDRFEARINGEESLAREYRGIITEALTPEERQELAQLRAHEYSASQLELYARCPFKFFSNRILNVNPPATYDVTLTPLERGALLHTVLFKLYTKLRGEGALPITPETREEVIRRAREIAEEEIAGIVFDHPYWRIDQERLLGGDLFGGLLEEWIDADIDLGEEKTVLEPAFFEVTFGQKIARGGDMDRELGAPHEVELHDVKIRGKVDRVEVYQRDEDLYFAVADYKTGTPPTRREVGEGTSLQLMIYLEVIRYMLAERFGLPPENVKPAGGIYYQLKARGMEVKPTYLFVPNELKNDIIRMRRSARDPETVQELESIVQSVFENAKEYVEGIAAGDFGLTVRDTNVVCRNCDYQSACRIVESAGG